MREPKKGPMKTYELTYIISDAIADEDVPSTSLELSKEIEKLGGVIIKEEPWGKRKLAYPINHRNYGHYISLQLHFDGAKISDLDRILRLHPAVLRHLMLQVVPKALKATDEAELSQALEKRVEEKSAAPVAKTDIKVAKEVAPEELVVAEAKKPKKKEVTAEDEKHEEDESERRKLVDDKLSEILGETNSKK